MNNMTKLKVKEKETDPNFEEEQLDFQLLLSLAQLSSN